MAKFLLLVSTIFNLILHIGSNFPAIPRPETSLFFDTNENVQKTVNTLFSELKLSNAFRESSKNKIFVNIHRGFRNLTEISEQILKQVTNISRVSDNFTSSDGALDFIPILDDINREIKEEPNIISTEKPEVKHNDKIHFDDLNVTFEGSMEFMNDFWRIIKDLKLEDIVESNNTDQPTRRNFKVWDPSENLNSRRIFGGTKTRIQLYPFLATIHLDGEFVCAGSIISKEMVITAASCLHSVYKKPLNQRVKTRVGSDFATHSGILTTISKVYFHPSYNPTNLENNLAIARMASWETRPDNVVIRRIGYDKIERKLKDGTDLMILGWGARDAKQNLEVSDKNNIFLAQANLKTLNFEECRDVFTPKFIKSKNFCAGTKRLTKGGGACKNDIGAPAIINGELVGIVSFGPPNCGSPGIPTVFTKIGLYARWVNKVIKKVNLNEEDLDNELRNKNSISELTPARNTNILNTIKQAFAINGKSLRTSNIFSTILSYLSLPSFGFTQSDLANLLNKLFNRFQSVDVKNQPPNKIYSTESDRNIRFSKETRPPKEIETNKKNEFDTSFTALFKMSILNDKTDEIISTAGPDKIKDVQDEIVDNESEFNTDLDNVLDKYVEDVDTSSLDMEINAQKKRNKARYDSGDTRKDIRLIKSAQQKYGNVVDELERVWDKTWKSTHSNVEIDNYESN